MEFFRPYKYFSISLLLLGVLGCGTQQIEVTPGPRLQKVLDDHPKVEKVLKDHPEVEIVLKDHPQVKKIAVENGDKIEKTLQEKDLRDAHLRDRAAFLKSIRACGLGDKPADIDRTALSSRNAFTIGSEEIQKEKLHPVTALSIEGKIFSLENFKNSLEVNNQMRGSWLENSTLKNKTLNLSAISTSEDLTRAPPTLVKTNLPIVMGTQCFDLKAGETIDTEGRDIYIITNRASIFGTIRTTPKKVDDQPGAPGGSIYISAIETVFGEQSLLDVRGGDAGEIKMKPGVVLNDFERASLIAKIKSELVEDVDSPPKSRLPQNTEADAMLILNGWEENRATFFSLAQPEAIEDDIYNSARLGNGSPRDDLNAASKILRENSAFSFDRFSLIDQLNSRYNKALTKAWQAAIKRSVESLANQKAGKHDETGQSFWISDSKLAVKINEHEHLEKLRNVFNGHPFYRREKIQFQDLVGGHPGRVQIFSPLSQVIPRIENSSGKVSQVNQTEGEPDWIMPSNAPVVIPLNSYVEQRVIYEVHKDDDDKKIAPGEYSERQAERTTDLKVEIVSSNGLPKLVPHPNADMYRNFSAPPEPTQSHEAIELGSVFQKWGLQEKATRFREFIRINETFENDTEKK